VHNNRQMTGFVWVEPDAIEDDDDLRDWVETARRWVSQMPADDPKKKAAGRKAPAKKASAKSPAKKAAATKATAK